VGTGVLPTRVNGAKTELRPILLPVSGRSVALQAPTGGEDLLLLEAPDEKIANQIFNVGYQNLSIMEIARLVKRVVEEEFPENGPVGIVTTPSDDMRSYHINSDKIRRVLGFAPRHSIEEAVRDLCRAFRQGRLENSMSDDIYYNVRRMKNLRAA